MNRKTGFTIIEIMIIVAILGLLIGIAVPNVIRSKRNAIRNTCIQNMQLLTYAVEQYALENNASSGTTPPENDIWGTDTSYIKDKLKCPEGDSYYTVPNVGADAACPNVTSFPEHVLE